MRLIDESDVIKIIDKHTTEDGKLDDDISVILEEVKTAFNKEKVKKIIESCANEEKNNWDTYDDEYSFGAMNAHMRDISIIERGGIE